MKTINVDINYINFIVNNNDKILSFFKNNIYFTSILLKDIYFTKLGNELYLIYDYNHLNNEIISTETLFIIKDNKINIFYENSYILTLQLLEYIKKIIRFEKSKILCQ